jgi:NADPH:quinone reductase-like Zn-dependent oxidoreductase
MRAAQISSYGGPEVVRVTRDAVRPTPAEGQILVEVRASSLNPVDTVIRSGGMRQMLPLEWPATLGGDFAGVVVDVGPGAGGFAARDEVYGQATPLLGGSGALAELVAARAGMTALKPRTLDFTAAAALPLVGTSAVQAIVDHIDLQPGQRILIHGAAGGVGSIAVQIAKHLGAYVIATAFTDDVGFVKNLGADEVIDATAEAFETVVRDVDGVLDTAGGNTAERSYGVLKRGGVLVSMTAQPDEERMKETGVRAIGQFTQPTTERLTKLAVLVDAGIVTPNVDRVFSLDEAAAAFAHREFDKPRGKVVVAIAGRAD